ncbi:MAG: hypothetical protein LIO94_11540 [Clostridiales bacterium]|nr:hypothetical protein [Clostridiales bacterium]
MKTISMLDCTLRDGGWANDFQFGRERMRALYEAVEESGIEYVELGYLDAGRADQEGQSMYPSLKALCREIPVRQRMEESILERGVADNQPDLKYCAADRFMGRRTVRMVMIDHGKYPIDVLPPCRDSGIDGIRLCFHKKDAAAAISEGRMILKKGYLFMLQPMVCTRYTDGEFAAFLQEVQKKLPELAAVYLVDSFGSMRPEDVFARLHLADRYLAGEIRVGIHAHNNLHQAFSNASAAFTAGLHRSFIIDGTLAGIGKGAGNLRTEGFADYLNRNAGKAYDYQRLETAARMLVEPLRATFPWGCCAEYEWSAMYHLTPSYAKFFSSNEYLSTEEIKEILLQVPEEKKDSFDRGIAGELLERALESKGGIRKNDRSA